VVSIEPKVIAATQRKSSFYRPELDLIRFIAFLSVFLYHLSFMRRNRGPLYLSVAYSGAFGMCLFFVLSSYLITKLLVKEWDATGSIKVSAFYARRVLRIWPLYFFMIGVIWLIGHFYQPWHVNKGVAITFSFLAGNWYLMRHYLYVPGPIFPLWSISVEEQFYLVWPSLFRCLSRRTFQYVAIAVILLSWIAIFTLRQGFGQNFAFIWWNTLAQIQFFGIGALLALFDDRLATALSSKSRQLLAAGAIVAWVLGGFCNQASLSHVQPGVFLVISYIFAALGCLLYFKPYTNGKVFRNG
jgi:peptidoglycan/LPS O-acetylase OafA/YrhL